METKTWVEAHRRTHRRAGLATVLVAQESKAHAQQVVDTEIRAVAQGHTDGSPSLRHVTGGEGDDHVVSGDQDACARWLPWVPTMSANATAWVTGTPTWGEGQPVGALLGRVHRSVEPSP